MRVGILNRERSLENEGSISVYVCICPFSDDFSGPTWIVTPCKGFRPDSWSDGFGHRCGSHWCRDSKCKDCASKCVDGEGHECGYEWCGGFHCAKPPGRSL